MEGNNVKHSFVFYDSFFETLQTLDNEDRDSANALYRTIALYGLYRIEPKNLTNIQKAIFAGMRAQLEANWIKYENGMRGAKFGNLGGAPKGNGNARKTTPKQPQNNPETTRNVECRMKMKNENGECKGDCKGETDADGLNASDAASADKPRKNATKRTAFVAPIPQEVKEYFSTIEGTERDADSFFDHFTANGWMVGGKSPMKDWRAAARNWMRPKSWQNNERTTTSHENKPRYKAL